MKGCGQAADDYEINTCVAQCLHRFCELHQERLRAAPRARSRAVDALSSFLARSAGVKRNCSMSSVKSIP